MIDTVKQPVSTDQNPACSDKQNAMQDEAIVQRLEENPEDPDAQLDAGLDQSMDASDPVATVQPGDTGEPMPSSGFDEVHEEELRSK